MSLCNASYAVGHWESGGAQQLSRLWKEKWSLLPRNPSTGEEAAGRVSRHAFCARRESRRFVPHCARLSAEESVAELSKRRLTVVGDSVALQLWTSLWLLSPARRWPDAVSMHCLPSPQLLERVLRRAGVDREGVLVLQAGVWYNRNASCAPYDGRARENATFSALCGGPAPRRWAPAASDPCLHGLSLDLCHARARAFALHQCALEEDLVRTASWVEANRVALPRHVFVVDSFPQRIKEAALAIVALSARDSGRWRSLIARRVWRTHAPSVHFLSVWGVLAKQSAAHLDVAHYCLDSGPWNEAVAALLSAMALRVRSSRQGVLTF